MSEIIVRKAVEADIPQIAVIEAESFSDPWTEDSLRSQLSQALGIFLAAEIDGTIVGYIIGSQDGDSAFIDNIAAAGSERRKGVGTALMKAFLAELPETVCRAVLEVRESNIAAQKLYSRFGFKVAGVRKNLYSSPQEDGFVMICILDEG